VLPGIDPARPERQHHGASLAWQDRRVLHVLLYGGVAVVAAVALFFLAVWLLPAGEQIAPPLRDEPLWSMPGRPLHGDDIDAVRLPVAMRGYRFAETDQLLDRLAAELRRRDDEIARLRGYATAPAHAGPVQFSKLVEPSAPDEAGAPTETIEPVEVAGAGSEPVAEVGEPAEGSEPAESIEPSEAGEPAEVDDVDAAEEPAAVGHAAASARQRWRRRRRRRPVNERDDIADDGA
jgi:DivIVA domain-containing protein